MTDKVYIQNRRASHDYFFLKEWVAGIVLHGTEVKSIRDGKVSLVDSFCYINNGELFVKGMTISDSKNSPITDTSRDKKLLLRKEELIKLQKEMINGTSLIVKKLFSSERGYIKVEIALAKGKKNYDKRQVLKEKEIQKEINSAVNRN